MFDSSVGECGVCKSAVLHYGRRNEEVVPCYFRFFKVALNDVTTPVNFKIRASFDSGYERWTKNKVYDESLRTQ